MATRLFCDRCDREVRGLNHKDVLTSIHDAEGFLIAEFCESCWYDVMEMISDDKKWARISPWK